MNDEVETFGTRAADLEDATGAVGADEHCEVVEGEDSDWVVVGVEHVTVGDAVLARARQDDRVIASTYLDTRSMSTTTRA